MPAAETTITAPPGADWLRERLEELEAIDRPSASAGEWRAAQWIAERMGEEGAEARIEEETAQGTYWWPVGLGTGCAALAGLAALRGHRLIGALGGALAAAAVAGEFPPAKRPLRSKLPPSRCYNVVTELGPPEAERTVVVVSHHDAAHSGLVFHPEIPRTLDRLFPGAIDNTDTSPPLMWGSVGGPAAIALGSLVGSRALTRLGTLISAGYAAAMAEIGSRGVVPGANDNGTGVVTLLALARALRERPTESTRVMLLSVGSEESFSEGIKAFGERHFDSLPKDKTFFMIVDTVGSPRLNVLRGEGFLKMYEYPAEALALVDGLADELGIYLQPNLRLRNGTDGLEPLAAGYPTIAMCSNDELKQPSNYHWPTDVAANVDYDTFADAIRLTQAVIRRLDERWL